MQTLNSKLCSKSLNTFLNEGALDTTECFLKELHFDFTGTMGKYFILDENQRSSLSQTGNSVKDEFLQHIENFLETRKSGKLTRINISDLPENGCTGEPIEQLDYKVIDKQLDTGELIKLFSSQIIKPRKLPAYAAPLGIWGPEIEVAHPFGAMGIIISYEVQESTLVIGKVTYYDAPNHPIVTEFQDSITIHTGNVVQAVKCQFKAMVAGATVIVSVSP